MTTTETCLACGRAMEITRATLATGLRHPACKFGWRALTASAIDLDRHALRLWSLRTRLATAEREHARSDRMRGAR